MEMAQRIGKFGMGKLALFLACVGAFFQRWALDPDAWFILNGGRYVMEHGIPHVEPFTMHEGLHFVLEQWLTGVIFWNIYESYGPSGLLHLVFWIGVVLLYAYYRLCLLVSDGNRQTATIMTMAIGFVAAPVFFVTRPQVISTLFFVIEVLLLERYARTNRGRYLLPLPILSLFLVNLHAALWPMLLLFLLPFLVPCLLKRMRCRPSIFLESRWDAKPLLLASLGIFLAGFGNPYGWEAMSFVFYSYDPEIHGHISEIHPATLTGIGAVGPIFFVLLFLLAIVYGRNIMPMQYVFLTLGTGLMGLLALRSIFLFLFLGTFPLAYAARNWRSSLLSSHSPLGSPLGFLPFAALCVLAGNRALREGSLVSLPLGHSLLLLWAAICLVCYVFFYKEKEKRFSFQIPLLRMKYMAILLFFLLFFGSSVLSSKGDPNFGETYRPTIDYLLERHASSDVVLWTGFNTGAYPEFRGIRCYVDARPEVFLPSNSHQDHNIIQEYFDLVSGKIYYKDFFRQYHFTHVLTTENDGVLHVMLPHDEDFRLLYEQKDEKGEVLCRLFEPVALE